MVAIVITSALFYVTIQHMEPFESFVKMNKSFNDYWTQEFRQNRMEAMMKMRQQMQQGTIRN